VGLTDEEKKDWIAKRYNLLSGTVISLIRANGSSGYSSNLFQPAIGKEEKSMCISQRRHGKETLDIIHSLCEDRKPFTGLDVSNALKKKGVRVRHCEIAPLVREAYDDGEMIGYVRGLIDVHLRDGKVAQAYLYHHNTTKSDDYDERHQVALFLGKKTDKSATNPTSKRLGVSPVGGKKSVSSVSGKSGVDSKTKGKMFTIGQSIMRHHKKDGRLEVPCRWLSHLGWLKGCVVKVVEGRKMILLKRHVDSSDTVIRDFTVDRWGRVRVTSKILKNIGDNKGDYVLTLKQDSIEIL
jgi:hypothetical protein